MYSAIDAPQILDYLSRLSILLGMQALSEPVTHLSSRFGWAHAT